MIRQLLVALTARTAPIADDAEPTSGHSPTDLICWQEQEQNELCQWWAEMERRVLSGELVDPEEDLPPRQDEDSLSGPQDEIDPDERLPDEASWPPDWRLEDAPRAEQQPTPPGEESPPQPSSPTPDGLWAAADRAVDDASLALFRVGEKLTHAQRLVRAAAAADEADEAAHQASLAGRTTDAEDAIAALLSTTDTQRERLTELLTTTAGGGLADRPRIALADALSGALLALTDLPGLTSAGTCGDRECRREPARCTHDLTGHPGFGPPGPTDGYRPAAELDRWMRARDRRCRFPGCRRRVPRGGELDHHRPYPDGPTSAGNLAGYCTTDHRATPGARLAAPPRPRRPPSPSPPRPGSSP